MELKRQEKVNKAASAAARNKKAHTSLQIDSVSSRSVDGHQRLLTCSEPRERNNKG